MVSGLQEGIKYEYKIKMQNWLHKENYLVREFTSEFNTEECWGYNRFYKLENLEKDGFIN
jgi:tripartite motif-containing protein 37